MLAFSYLRFSTPEQIKGDSFRRQTEASDKFIAENGLVLDTSLNMHDLGLSAFDKSNVTKGRLGGFIRAIEQGKIPPGSYLIVESLDRLSRAQVLEALQQFIAIVNAGITIVTLSDGQQYAKESLGDNPMQLLISITIMARAHEESAMKSKRISAAWNNKKKQVIESGKLLTRKTPMWIKVVDGKLELIPERAIVVKRIYEMARQGIGGHTIVKVMNDEVPAWNKVGHWQVSYIQKLLNNVAVYGAIDIDGTIVENYYPALLTKDEWNYVTILRGNRRTTERSGSRKGQALSNLFSGLLKCGYCGAGMQMSGYVETRHGAHKRRKYLICNGARTGATSCKCIQWDYNDFEGSFLLRAGSLDISNVLGTKQEGRLRELEELAVRIQLEIETTAKKIENLIKAIEEEPLPGLVKRMKGLEAEREALEAKLRDVEKHVTVERMSTGAGKDRIAMILRLFREQTVRTNDEKRILREALSEQIRAIVEKIVMYPGGPSCNKDGREERHFYVHFMSGQVVEMV